MAKKFRYKGLVFLVILAGAIYGARTILDKPPAVVSRRELEKNWPGFRGVDGNGIVYSSDIPTSWDGKTGTNILWKVAIPLSGLNSPIVWDKKIFLSGGDKKIREVYCFDGETGELLWRREVKESQEKPPKVSKDTGYAASTMATDGKRVYAIFATGEIVSFTFDGQRVWGRDLGVPKNHYGHSSSLIIHDHMLIVQFDHSAGARILALDTRTGATVWENKRQVALSWASPTLVDGKWVVLTASPLVCCYDVDNGREMWSVECMEGEVAPSPAYANGKVFVASVCLAALDVQTGEVLWETEEVELPDVASPLATEKYLVLASSEGTVTCLDPNSGDIFWTQQFDHGFYSSPILVGDKVYLLDISGCMHIFALREQFHPLGKCEMGATAITIPAFVKGRIYIRTNDHLFCIGGQSG